MGVSAAMLPFPGAHATTECAAWPARAGGEAGPRPGHPPNPCGHKVMAAAWGCWVRVRGPSGSPLSKCFHCQCWFLSQALHSHPKLSSPSGSMAYLTWQKPTVINSALVGSAARAAAARCSNACVALGVDPLPCCLADLPGPEHPTNVCGVDPVRRVAPVSEAWLPPGSSLE